MLRTRTGPARTRVFEIAARHGYPTQRQLARAMGLDEAAVSRVRRGQRRITAQFIEGARRAFPGYAYEYLFPADEPEGVPA